MCMPRLVGADLRRDDRTLEGNADPLHRRLDEVAIRVGEDGELPAALPRLGQRAANFGERFPGRQRRREAPCILVGSTELAHRLGHHLAVAQRSVCLERGLDVVIPLELVLRALLAEHAHKHGANAAVPVDQRPVTVECRPALGHYSSKRLSTTQALWPPKPNEFETAMRT